MIQRPTRLGLGKIRMGESFSHNAHTAFEESILLLWKISLSNALGKQMANKIVWDQALSFP